jgi:hypothetical protein
MHFRERGKIIQIIRSSPESGSKKAKNVAIGRLKKSNPEISSKLEAVLSDKERKEVKSWIESYGSTERLKMELAARTLSEQMAITEEWFKDQKGEDARLLAATLYRSWVQLRIVIKKSGLIE